MLSVFAQEIEFLEDFTDARQNQKIYLNGFLCKPPVFRITPLGREVVDLLIAVNRAYGKSDYIPAIAWGRTARYLSRFEVGCHVELRGRFQSREYYKNHEDGTQEVKTAYEFSAGWVK